jgi:hypothetical protein
MDDIPFLLLVKIMLAHFYVFKPMTYRIVIVNDFVNKNRILVPPTLGLPIWPEEKIRHFD